MKPFARAGCSAAVLLALLVGARSATAAKIACVGDSITFGYGLAEPSTQSYPAVLASRLGSGHTVQNFGVSGATLLKSGDRPYWDETSFEASSSFDPDVVVVMLGTNDAKPQNWARQSEFSPDYLELIQHYRSAGALVYVATPPPVFGAGAFDISPAVVAGEVVPLVRTIAEDASAPLVDVFTALSGQSQNFPDTVHPNAAGAALLAEAVAAALEEHGFGGAGAAGGAGQGGLTGAGGRGTTDAGAGPGGTAGDGASTAAGGMSAGASSVAGMSGAASGGAPVGSGGGSTQGGMASALGGTSATTAGAPGAGASGSGGAGAASTTAGAPAAGGASGGSVFERAGAPGASTPSSSPGEGSGCGCRAPRQQPTPLAWWVPVVLAAAIGTRGSARRRSRGRTP